MSNPGSFLQIKHFLHVYMKVEIVKMLPMLRDE